MAWATAADSGFRITGFTFDPSGTPVTILGRIRAFVQKIIDREVLQYDGDNFPSARPVDSKDARAVLAFAAMEQFISETVAAKNLKIDFTAADGGAGSITIGKMLPGSVDFTMQRRMGGFMAEQTFELEGDLTLTVSI